MTKCKKYNIQIAKIQTQGQNTTCQNTNATQYKWNKMQKYQNINTPKNKRNSILGVPIENQCVKGGGLLYGGCI